MQTFCSKFTILWEKLVKNILVTANLPVIKPVRTLIILMKTIVEKFGYEYSQTGLIFFCISTIISLIVRTQENGMILL